MQIISPARVDAVQVTRLEARALDGDDIAALGRANAQLRVRVTSDGSALPEGTSVRVDILGGDATFATGGATADLVTDARGDATLRLNTGTHAGTLHLRFTVGDATADANLALVAAAPPAIVVGFATGGIGPVPGWIEAPDGAPNGTRARRGAVSIFGSGAIANDTRGTFAYDSADVLAPSLATGPFVDDPNDRPFPIYGDTSLRRDDALSTNRWYARVENHRSSAMWGELYAHGGGTATIGGYDVLVNGAQLVAAGSALSVRAFTASNHTAYDRRTIAPTGLAIADQMLYPDIVVGSDVLALVRLDRRTGATLGQKALVRGTDYVLDYASGMLRFTNVILPYDDEFDPQIVVVSYQYGGPGAHSTMLGGSARLALTPRSDANAWYLNDAHGEGNLALIGASLSGGNDATQWSLSHERSTGYVPVGVPMYGTAGDASLLAFSTHANGYRFDLTYQDTSAAYQNPYGAYASAGMQQVHAAFDVPVGSKSDVELSYLGASNQLPATLLTSAVSNTDSSAAATLHVRPDDRFSYRVGVRDDSASSNGALNPSLLLSSNDPQNATGDLIPLAFTLVEYQAGVGHAVAADAGAAWRFAKHARVSASRVQPLGGAIDPYAPAQTTAQVDLDVGSAGTAFVRQLWQSGSVQALSGTQSAQSAAGTSASATMVGFSQLVGATTLESGYAVQHTASGTDLFNAIGARGKLIGTKSTTLDAFMQLGEELLTTTGIGPRAPPYFVATGASLAYAAPTFRANAQAQVRTGYNAGSTYQVGAAGAVSDSLSLFGALTGSFAQGVRDLDLRGGLSLRPADNDRYVTLLSVDSQQSNITDYDAYVTNVAQIQELYRPGDRTELAGSLAYKLTGDGYFAPRTVIYGVRARQRVGSRLDVGAEVHRSSIEPLDGDTANGLAIELGQRVGSTLRVAVGYNFSGFVDPTTATSPTHRGIYVTVGSYLDRIFGWGKDGGK